VSTERLNLEDRKDLLLLLLGARGAEADAEPILGVTRLQKYLFLLQQQYEWDRRFGLRTTYDFSAYDYGPFDAQLYDDLQFLENAGLVRREDAGPEPAAEDDESRQLAYEWATVGPEVAPWEEDDRIYRYSLTRKGKEFVQRYQLTSSDWETLASLKHQWNRRPLQDLLRWLYNKYPRWAENSKLRHLKG
jgi:uncharacterized protein